MPTDNPDLKDKTVQELFAETLVGEYDDERPWAAIEALRLLTTPEVFQESIEFCKSKEPRKRAAGMSVLAQFGVTMENHSGPYLDERLATALQLLSDEDGTVVQAAAWTLSNMRGERGLKALLTVRHHANPHVRHAVAAGLLGETSPEAVSALIELMQDNEGYVRDWATFSLGTDPMRGPPIDSTEIREAFRGRLTDTDEDARHEASWALAIRKDPAGLQILLDRLEADEWLSGDQNAAEYALNLPNDAPIEDIRDGLQRLLAESQSKTVK